MSSSEATPQLSVACLVRDAGDRLRETLTSIAPIADEIVIGDTGSSDHTLEVAQQFEANLVTVPWDDDFASARNAVSKHVQGRWVLWLDAGETLTPDAAQQLKQFVAQTASPDKAYMLLVKRPAGSEVEGEQVGCIRLFSAQRNIRFTGRVRETVESSLAEQAMEAEGLPFRIHRGVCEHDPDVKQQRAHRNLKLAQLELREQGVTPRLLNAQAEAWQILGNTAEARPCYRQVLERAEPSSSDRLEAYYGLLTSMDGDAEAADEQLQVCLAGLQEFPLDSQLLCAMGSYLQARGRLDLAARSYETAYRYGEVVPVIWHVDQIRDIAAVCFSLTLQLQQQDAEALDVLRQAVAANPQSSRLRRQLMELAVKRGESDEALEQLEALSNTDTAPADSPANYWETLRSGVRGACLASQGNAVAARAYLEAAYHAGCRDPLCLRWLLITLFSSGEQEAAREVLQQWRQSHPDSVEIEHFHGLFTQSPENEPVGASDPDPRRMRVDADNSSRPNAGSARPETAAERTSGHALPGNLLSVDWNFGHLDRGAAREE